MWAHSIVGYDGPDSVEWTEVEDPPENGQVLIEVKAAGVSFADLLQTRGQYQLKPALPYTPGMEAAGVVCAASLESGIEVGQRVAVLLRRGCWQQLVSAPSEKVLPLPEDVSFEEGSALPLNYLTTLLALVWRGHAQSGETLVVHGAAGGLGTAAVQVGRALGLRVIAVVNDEAKRGWALDHGASDALLGADWLTALKALVGDHAVDIVFDPVGGERVTDSLRALAPHGRLLVLGFAAGEIASVRTNRLLLGNTSVLGIASIEYFEEHPGAARSLWSLVQRLRTASVLPSPPVRAFSFSDARGALRAIESRQARGKMVLSAQSETFDRSHPMK